MRITQVTRRNIADAIMVEKINWWGRLSESGFLSRIFDLGAIPSRDSRYSDAAGDIWQHRDNNLDWDDDWIFYDDRFNLLHGDDELFLRFLTETIHPVIRTDVTECNKLCQMYNSFLKQDGYELVEKTQMSGNPIFSGRVLENVATPGILAAKETFSGFDTSYLAQQITRMETAVENDPDLAIGTAKELVETCCKTLLLDREIEVPKGLDMPKLVKMATMELQLTPNDIQDMAKASKTIKRLLSNLATITQGIVELRNQYGTGHGKHALSKGLSPRHAKLAVGAASTLAVFLYETHEDRRNLD